MDAHHGRKQKWLDIVDKVGEIGDVFVPQVFVDERPGQQITATEAADVGEQAQRKDHSLDTSWWPVLCECHVGAAESLETFLVQGDQAPAGLVVVFHRRVDGDDVAGALSAEDEVGETDVLEGGVFGFRGGDSAEGLQVELEGVAMVGVHVFDDEVLA